MRDGIPAGGLGKGWSRHKRCHAGIGCGRQGSCISKVSNICKSTTGEGSGMGMDTGRARPDGRKWLVTEGVAQVGRQVMDAARGSDGREAVWREKGRAGKVPNYQGRMTLK